MDTEWIELGDVPCLKKSSSYSSTTIDKMITKLQLLGNLFGDKHIYKLRNEEIVIAIEEGYHLNFRYNAETASYYVLVPPGIFD